MFEIVLCGWLSKLWSLLGTLNIRCRIIIRTQKGTLILITTHVALLVLGFWVEVAGLVQGINETNRA